MRKTITIVLILSTLLFGGLSVYSRVSGDRTKPVITVPTGEIVYTEGDSSSKLLEGATAYDETDGDLSSNIRIYDIAIIEDKNSALVTYAVYDNSFNLAKATKVVRYVTAAEAAENGETPSDESAVEADTQVAVKTEEKVTEVKTTEEKTVEEKTTEEKATEATTAASETTVTAAAPVVKLSKESVTISVGDSFSAMDYVQSVEDDKDSLSTLFRNVRMTGEYSTTKAGTYQLSYYCTDSDGNESAPAVLTLTVK